MAPNEDLEINAVDLRKLLGQQLHSLAQFGVTELAGVDGDSAFDFEPAAAEVVESADPPKPVSRTEKSSRPTATTPPKPAAQPIRNDKPWGTVTASTQRPAALEVLNTSVKSCERCPELCANRTQTVFGVGSPNARLVFVGEGPGADEDRSGEPFVGAAGKMLNKILVASKLKREEVYILNTVKCRPPRNRNPTETEIGNCWTFAEEQLEIIQPEFICCLGSVAAKTMLQTADALGRLRGRFHQWRGAKLVATYHPAYLLRNESAKRHVWEDMKMLVKEMGIDLSN